MVVDERDEKLAAVKQKQIEAEVKPEPSPNQH